MIITFYIVNNGMAFAILLLQEHRPPMNGKIKNIRFIRCKIIVEGNREGDGQKDAVVEMTEAQILANFTAEQLLMLKTVLSAMYISPGTHSLKWHQKKELANKIIAAVSETIQALDGNHPNIKYSHIISKKLNYSYNYLTTIFAEVKGITIENFIILDKIERVKEYIAKGNFTFTQIALNLQYSNVSHLSSQFKRITGLTPTQFRKLHGQEKIKKPAE